MYPEQPLRVYSQHWTEAGDVVLMRLSVELNTKALR